MRIWFSGAFWTGKSTLYENVYEEWHIKHWEVARSLLEKKQIKVENFSPELLNSFQNEVLEKQLSFERDNDNFLQDTTLLDFLAYSKDAEDYNFFLKEISKHFNKRAYDIIFYTPIEFDIEDDWLRHTDKEFQHIIDDRIKFNLHMTACKTSTEIVTVKGDIEQRVKQVMDYLYNYKQEIWNTTQ